MKIKIGNFTGFTGKEVFEAERRAREKVIPGEQDSSDCLANELNAILAKHLAEAPNLDFKTFENNYSGLPDHFKCKLVNIEDAGGKHGKTTKRNRRRNSKKAR